VSDLDVAALTAWLDAKDVGERRAPVTVWPIAGGASNEIFDVQRGEQRMVLRMAPATSSADRHRSMLREYQLLRALDGTDVPHADAIAVCEDASVLGGTFVLMAYVDGWSPMTTDGWPTPFDNDLDARYGLGVQLVDGIARLARVDWRSRGLEEFGKPDGFHERQVDRWVSHLAGVRTRELPGFDEAAEWLRAHRPRNYEPGIMHGDYQFANVMYAHGAPAQLAAIIDWEMATIGDPLLDLAWVMQGWPVDGQERTMSYVDYTGLPSRDEVLQHYVTVSGRAVDDIDYYVVLARFKLAAVLEARYARWRASGADNPKVEAFGPVVLDLAQSAAELAQSTSL
jgi:aminoglycoside phosphotransferase (APT) family kinase protein